MKSFKMWAKKYIEDNTPYGDVARFVNTRATIPYFKKKSQVIDFIKISWKNASAITTFEEMYDIYEQEVIIPYHGGLSEVDYLKKVDEQRKESWKYC